MKVPNLIHRDAFRFCKEHGISKLNEQEETHRTIHGIFKGALYKCGMNQAVCSSKNCPLKRVANGN